MPLLRFSLVLKFYGYPPPVEGDASGHSQQLCVFVIHILLATTHTLDIKSNDSFNFHLQRCLSYISIVSVDSRCTSSIRCVDDKISKLYRRGEI